MRREEGFTLIEVLVASTLLAFALLALVGASLTAFATSKRSGEETAAWAIGQQRVEWLRNQGYDSVDLAAGTNTEGLTGSYAGYSRRTAIQDNTPHAGLKTVVVTTWTPSGVVAQVFTLISRHQS